jgi:hypothetical protein
VYANTTGTIAQATQPGKTEKPPERKPKITITKELKSLR